MSAPNPAFPPLQPTASTQPSIFQSYSGSSSLASQSPPSSAPLPSSSSIRPQHHGCFDSRKSQQQQPQQQQVQSQAATQRQSAQRQSSYEYAPQNRQDAGSTAAETKTYLDQYVLLAEAAKRAQMAIVVRDIESMEL